MANIFPKWTNRIVLKVAVCVVITGGIIALLVPLYFTQNNTRVGYEPDQVIPFSHPIHVGQLGMDCRYCHSFVDKSPHANLPSAQTCLNCHTTIKKDSSKLAPLFEKDASGKSKKISWTHVHKMPQYVYFDHSVHINRGVGCVECHGRVDKMDKVRMEKSMSMGFCVECHENPTKRLRPVEHVFNLEWKPEDESSEDIKGYLLKGLKNDKKYVEKYHKILEKHNLKNNSGKKLSGKEIGKVIKELWNINPPSATNCGGCHR